MTWHVCFSNHIRDIISKENEICYTISIHDDSYWETIHHRTLCQYVLLHPFLCNTIEWEHWKTNRIQYKNKLLRKEWNFYVLFLVYFSYIYGAFFQRRSAANKTKKKTNSKEIYLLETIFCILCRYRSD